MNQINQRAAIVTKAAASQEWLIDGRHSRFFPSSRPTILVAAGLELGSDVPPDSECLSQWVLRLWFGATVVWIGVRAARSGSAQV